jgi:trans-4-hydroxy-L-proline dehydratase
VAWNYDQVLAQGIEGLIRRHREAWERSGDARAREYYGAVIVCLEGVLAWNRRHVEALREQLAAADTGEKRALTAENLAVMERVPALPARTFREAVQSFYFQWLCVMYDSPWGGNSPGRLDYFLWPYLQAEYESGALSHQDAAELVAELFIKMDERVHLADGHVNTIVVGGVRPDGGDAVNPLTYIMLDVFEQLDLTHPAVYTRLSAVNPPEYIERCVDTLLKGRNRAQILADEPILAAMTRGGRMRREDAAMYVCGGCMELNPHGMNSDLLFAFTYNVPKALELLITGGRCLVTGRPRLRLERTLADYPDFESFYAAFEAEVRRHLTAKFRELDLCSEEWARWRPNFLLSSMIADCLERGRSQQDGGARYPDYGGTPLGIQNAADSLQALKTAVFDERFCTAGELTAALTADFQGWASLQARLKAVPKYGCGDAAADAMMRRVLASVCAAFDSYTNRHGGRVKPIIFTFVWAPEMGRALGASPDGRRAGAPIAHGVTPQAAGMTEGLTAAIGSLAALDLDLVSGGASTMWDLDPAWISPELLTAIVRTFVRRGGQIFQGNMTSVEDLRRALEAPESYPNLIVRVGGFSARFAGLGKDCQREIIERYRHAR